MASDTPIPQQSDSSEGQAIFAVLRDTLAVLYPIDQDARRVVDDAGLIAIRITFSSRAQTNWHNILAEAVRQNSLDLLLKVALSDYTANPSLLVAYDQYRLFIAQGNHFEVPDPLPTGASVTIAGDVNLDQGDFIGRDKIVHFLITGDYNKVFVGNYERLQDAYINPSSVFDRINLEHFTGREWLLAAVDRFLQAHDRGYFILEADAGLGKTAFLAWLAQHRRYIHHFSELTPGQEGVGIALCNLAAQLSLAYELRPEGVLPSAATRPDYLYNLLKQAAHKRRQDEKIVLIVDALDEAGTPLNQNVLGLPATLPEGVYVIVSQRPVAVALRVETTSTPRATACRLRPLTPRIRPICVVFWSGLRHGLVFCALSSGESLYCRRIYINVTGQMSWCLDLSLLCCS